MIASQAVSTFLLIFSALLSAAAGKLGQENNKKEPNEELFQPSDGEIDTIWFEPPDIEAALIEDAENEGNKTVPFRVAVELTKKGPPVTIHNSGTTETVEGGEIWRAKLCSEGAKFVRINFAAFQLKEGMEMRFYAPGEDPDSREPVAVTNEEVREFGFNDVKEFGSYSVCGECIIAQLFMPDSGNNAKPAFNVRSLSYGYKEDFLECNGQSGRRLQNDCLVDVSCAESAGINGDWTDQSRAVARIFDGQYSCSGAMIRDVAGNCNRQFFLTAHHCVPNGSTAGKLSFFFHHECTACINGVASSCSGGVQVQKIGGANYKWGKSANQLTDTTLLKILVDIPKNVYRAGFDADTYSPETRWPVRWFKVTYIHHPYAKYKKITQKWREPTVDGYKKNRYWKVEINDPKKFIGDSAGGSSGGPLFYTKGDAQRIIGQLYGGTGKTCGGTGYDVFGRLDISWDNGLCKFLGSCEKNTIRIVDGMDCPN